MPWRTLKLARGKDTLFIDFLAAPSKVARL
jgi:hypothetical protein